MNKKIQILIAASVIAVLVIGYIASIGKENKIDADSKNKELFTVRVPTMNTGLVAEHIAEKLGFFEEEGIKIEYVGEMNADLTPAALSTGDIDIASYHIPRYLLAMNKGAKLKIVGPGTKTAPGYPHTVWYVLENSSIKTPKDLIGKRIGVYALAGCDLYITLEYLREQGIDDPKNKVTFVQIPFAQQEQALKQGSIDVAALMGVFTKRADEAKGLRKLFDDNEIHRDLSFAGPVTTEKFINEHPDVVRGYIRAIVKAEQWINEHHKEAEQIGAKKLGLDVKYVTSYHYPENGLINKDAIEPWFDILVKNGDITEWKIKPTDVYTNTFSPYYKW